LWFVAVPTITPVDETIPPILAPTTKTTTSSVMALGSLASLAIQPAAFFIIPFETETDKAGVAGYGVWR
jgi:hypothetical protein